MDNDIIPPTKPTPSGPIPEPPQEPSKEPETTNIEPINFNIDPEPEIKPQEPVNNFTPEKPKKKSNVVTLILILIAICGVAFGIYGIMFAPTMQKCESPKDLTVRIQSEDGSTTTLETDKISTSSDGKTITIADSKTESSSKGYIYIGEWGLKIKIPETLKYVGYNFGVNHNNLEDNGGEAVYLTGISADFDGETLPDFAIISKDSYGLGGLSRNSKEKSCDGPTCGAIVYEDDEYEYRYGHPQAVYSTEQADIDLETKSANLIEEMLRNKENYSKF